MKTLEFQGNLTADRKVEVPEGIAKQMPAGQTFRVLIIMPETENKEQEWAQMAAAEFLKGYAESDAVYDDLPTG